MLEGLSLRFINCHRKTNFYWILYTFDPEEYIWWNY